MSVPKSLALAAAIVLGVSTLADAAPRARRGESAYGAAPARPAAGSCGGYSCNPQTRDLEQLADKYRPGW